MTHLLRFLPSLLIGLGFSLVSSSPSRVIAEPEVPALASYLPADADHDPAAPTPESVLGWPFAAWHLHHHELIEYLRALDAWSDRVSLVEYARSHGRRPLVMLRISSPENQSRLDTLRQTHLETLASAAEPSRDGASSPPRPGGETPLILWMGYGIHGNEPSASQAAVLLAYHLAAARSPEVQRFLESTVVLIDPCLNPDGMERFAAWTNSHRGRVPSPHRGDREHIEDWPGGRSNYYWFDMNRDWLPMVHPESRGRIELFHQWMPHLLTDYHEMGNLNRTYFFQPGIPEMTHPLTPERNQRLTATLAGYHAKALDALGALYYTRESFDDYYIGKGSAYPDLCGSIGVLYEQAGTRGFHQDTEHGRLTFPVTIRNQVATSLSTLQAAHEQREDLIDHLLRSQREAIEAAEASPLAAHIVAAPGDPQRLDLFLQVLERHGIQCARPAESTTSGELSFPANDSLVIPTRQVRYPLLTAMLEKRTEFASPIFYDVSAWHLPSAYGLRHAELETLPALQDQASQEPMTTQVQGPEKAVAYLLPWESLQAPAALWRLHQEKVRTWVAQRPVVVGGGEELITYPHGTLMVPVGSQDQLDPAALRQLMESIARDHQIPVRALATGLGEGGIDLGSPSMIPLTLPKALLVVGSGTQAGTVGSIWHHFDQVWQAPLTLVDASRLSPSLLRGFTTLILADTSLNALNPSARASLQAWVAQGGCLIAIGTSVSTVAPLEWVGAKSVKIGAASQAKSGKGSASPPESPALQPYEESERRRAEQQLKGVVARAWYDATHPLLYGYSQQGPDLALMQVGTLFLEASSNSLHDPLRFTDAPLVAGFISEANLEAMKGSVPLQIRSHGSGRIVLFTFNPVFRGHWYGTAKLLANALFFSPTTSLSGGEDEDDAQDAAVE